MHNHKVIFVIFVASIVAVFVGINVVTAQYETIAWVVGVSVIVVCLAMGTKVWLLIPFLGAMSLTVSFPGRPTTMLVAQALVLSFSALQLIIRRLNCKIQIRELEIWMLLLFAMVVQVYIRNPVGFNVFGGSTVGAKPYVLFVAAILTSFLLCWLRVPAKEIRYAVWLSIIGGLINLVISVLGRAIPVLGYYTGTAGTVEASYSDQVEDVGKATRISYLGIFSENLSLWISSFKSPFLACFHPLWLPLLFICFGAAAMSGFRNDVAAIGLTFLVGIYYYGGIKQLLTSFGLGALALIALIVVNLVAPLPPNIQRSLSFLPGTWEERYVSDAEASSDWRVELWEEVLYTDRWISNKWIGDGLGFTARELGYQQSLQLTQMTGTGLSGFDAHREFLLANADYHSGPLQTIRVIGYFGLALLMIFQIRVVVYAHRQIQRCRGTEWFPVALFIGIPLIWFPVFFTLIYGESGRAAVVLFIGSGMLRLLENNLPLPAYRKKGIGLPDRPAVVSDGEDVALGKSSEV